MSKSSVPMPQPSAAIIVLISSELSIRSRRARSTFRIFPLSGRIAWKRRSRPCFAEPPAESPSTRKSSHCAGSSHAQSASFPGSEPPSMIDLRLARSCCADHLVDDLAADRRVLLEVGAQAFADDALDDALDLAVAELGLGL